MRVLVPLIGLATFVTVSLGGLLYDLAFTGSSAMHHYHWREMLFASVVGTLGAVTGLKARDRDTHSVSA